MAVSKLVAASAASKTMFRTTLTSGTSYTVPAGVTYLNLLLVGGGGGAGGSSGPSGTPRNSVASATPGESIYSTLSVTAGASIAYAIGAGGGGGGGGGDNGAAGGTTTFTGATSALGGRGGVVANDGAAGRISFVTNEGKNSSTNGSNGGGSGGSGFIVVEYWAQEIIMNKLFAVIEDNKVINIVVGVEDEVVAANPSKYIEYTNGWDYNNGIDGGEFFPLPATE